MNIASKLITKESKKNDRFAKMILRTIGLVLTSFFLSTLNAQEGFKIGPQVAFISSRAHVLDSLPGNFSFRFKSGFRVGITAQYGFTPKFVLASGINYSNKGYRVFNDTNSGGSILKHNISNLEIPVNMIVKFSLGSSSRMRFILGGTINYQLSSTSKTIENKKGNFVIKEELQHKIYPILNTGVEIANENKAGNIFVFGVYYSQSLSEQNRLRVYNSTAPSTAEKFSLGFRGSYVGIGLTYLFDIKNLKRDEVYFY